MPWCDQIESVCACMDPYTLVAVLAEDGEDDASVANTRDECEYHWLTGLVLSRAEVCEVLGVANMTHGASRYIERNGGTYQMKECNSHHSKDRRLIVKGPRRRTCVGWIMWTTKWVTDLTVSGLLVVLGWGLLRGEQCASTQ